MCKLFGRLGLFVLCLSFLVGCQSPPASQSTALASVTIESPSEARVRVAVIEVFEADQYRSKAIYEPEMVFERRGSLGDDLRRGGLLSGQTIKRVRVRVIPTGPETFRIDCNAFTVQYPDDRVMEQEFRIRSRGPYQELLERVRQSVTELRRAPAVR
jgi:hypothetical protein